MAGLRQTTAKLARYRGNWEKLLARSAAGRGTQPSQARTGRLTEITGFGSNPGNLRMRTYVPEACPARAPLVVVLHGCTQTAEGYEEGAGWSTLADRHGFALLLPEQQRANNPNTCFNWFLPGDTSRDSGETLSIRQMIDHMIATERVDRRRVYVTGLSAGGAMSAVMLATYPEVFAGGAIIAGLPYGAAGNVQEALDCMFQGKSLPPKAWGDRVRKASGYKGPWPRISVWHGGADSTVLPMNGEELVKQWTDVHGLAPQPADEDMVGSCPRRIWKNAAGEPMVEAYAIPGMAHGTPIAAGDGDENCGTPGPFILEAGISSSHRIAEFWGLLDKHGSSRKVSERTDSERIRVPAPKTSILPADKATSTGQPSGASTLSGPTTSARPEPAWKSTFDPHSVINKALRSAGLLKR